MLNFFPTSTRTCEGIDRRSFLRVGVLGGLGLSLPALLAGRQAQAGAGRLAADVNCICIWTRRWNQSSRHLRPEARRTRERPRRVRRHQHGDSRRQVRRETSPTLLALRMKDGSDHLGSWRSAPPTTEMSIAEGQRHRVG